MRPQFKSQLKQVSVTIVLARPGAGANAMCDYYLLVVTNLLAGRVSGHGVLGPARGPRGARVAPDELILAPENNIVRVFSDVCVYMRAQ